MEQQKQIEQLENKIKSNEKSNFYFFNDMFINNLCPNIM